jgi:LacI family transcriptional regulator, xylobiose transport system transcriptional regulator
MLARLAGVSAPTVSRVLNGLAGVALSTRQRVEEVIRQHGYRRPEGSERLAVLELVFHALDSPWALEIIQGVEQVARDNALAVVLTEMEGRLTPGKAWTEQVLTRRPTGVIAVFSELTCSSSRSWRPGPSRWWCWTRPVSRCTRPRRWARPTGTAAWPPPAT